MRFFISSDANWESRVDIVLGKLVDLHYRQYFETRTYGSGLDCVAVIFMCRDPSIIFKRRIRHAKKEKTLYMDIMLELPVMEAATKEARKCIIAQRLYDEVPEVLSRYTISEFDRESFISDLRKWIDLTGWRKPGVNEVNPTR